MLDYLLNILNAKDNELNEEEREELSRNIAELLFTLEKIKDKFPYEYNLAERKAESMKPAVVDEKLEKLTKLVDNWLDSLPEEKFSKLQAEFWIDTKQDSETEFPHDEFVEWLADNYGEEINSFNKK